MENSKDLFVIRSYLDFESSEIQNILAYKLTNKTMRTSLFLFFSIFAVQLASAQNFIFPLDVRPPYLSANFGELRSNHIHSGIDFKTEQVEGKIVRAIDTGYIARVQLSPSGYGHVLYVAHPNGFTSVYAHLKAFEPRVDSLVRAYQYEKKKHSVDISFNPDQLPVAQGDQIGLSGNSGSSGGPHLHFEIRKTENQHALNPMLFYDFSDYSRPKILRVGVYPMDSNSFVNHKQQKVFYETRSIGNGVFVIDAPITLSGNIGFSVQGYDYMPGMSNLYGFYATSLICNNQTIYSRHIDEVDFATTSDINSLIDYEEHLASKRNYEKLFVEQNNDLKIYAKLTNRGIYQTTDDDSAQCEIRVADIKGNTASIVIQFQQNHVDSLDVRTWKTKQLHSCVDTFSFSLGNFQFKAKANSFFKDYTMNITVDSSVYSRYYAPVYNIVTDQLIFKKAAEIIIPCSLPKQLQGKAIIEKCKSKTPVMTRFDASGYAHASIKTGGKYSVVVDTVPPYLKMIMENGANMTAKKYIMFKMSDNYSGIATYNAYIDGVWQILDFDAKNAVVFLNFDDKTMELVKTHTLKIVLEDLCHNVLEKEYTFYR